MIKKKVCYDYDVAYERNNLKLEFTISIFPALIACVSDLGVFFSSYSAQLTFFFFYFFLSS